MKKMKAVKPKKEKIPKDAAVKRRFPVKAIPFILLVIAAVAVLVWALPMLPQKPVDSAQTGYKGVVELWNVEAFEGGSGSRESWLVNKASKFEAANKGLFVHVTTLTYDQLKSKLENDQKFDMICFSRGAGHLIQDSLEELNVDCGALKNNFAVSGQLNGKQRAVPLYAGAYCLFARSSQLAENDLLASALSATFTRKVGKNTIELKPMICGFTDYNSPLSALALSGGKGKADVDEKVTQYQAYEKFVANNSAVTLLGTQRDIYRLTKKESDGKIEKLGFYALNGYTDLVQYLGVSVNAQDKKKACEEFTAFLLSKDVQSSLVNMSLFPTLEGEFYTIERFSACEKALTSAYVPNVFGDENSIRSQRNTAISTLTI